MQINDFGKICAHRNYKSWDKGNIVNYWKQGGLTIEQIYRNKEFLRNKTKSIAILGSVGKTTLSRILACIIKTSGKSCYLTKVNDNWLPQLPFAVELALKNSADFSIFECAIASKGDASLMGSVVPAEIVIYTQFASVNLSELKSLKGVAEEKIQFVLEKPHAKIVSHIKNKKYLEKNNLNPTYYGPQNSEAQFKYRIETMDGNSINIRIQGNHENVIKINDIGLHLGSAACGAIATCSEILGNTNYHSILELNSYTNPEQRMQKFKFRGIDFIIDTANSNELSILNSITTLIRLNTSLRKNIVIGGIYGLRSRQKSVIVRLINKMCQKQMNIFNSIHFVGSAFSLHQNELRKNIHTKIYFYDNENQFKERFCFENYMGQIVLLRGPTKKGVNLSNLIDNYNGTSDETTPGEITTSRKM